MLAKKESGFEYSPTIRKIYAEEHHITIGYGSYGGCFDLSNMRPNITIGNYCSIAPGVKMLRANHPYDRFTTHPITYLSSWGDKSLDENQIDYSQLIIGNDVWIGADAIILPGCKFIENGAIIGAGSIVTKDVPAYSIVAGNPAKVIRMRFSESVIQKLEATQWWLLSKEELTKNKENLEKIVRGE
ncbi:MAG: CatB-related O-acetyltransferase [Dysgonamonadaceae bacterium]|nr:CatB-related O-acetyltransferase [Dysgonamonadaceae bacterium]